MIKSWGPSEKKFYEWECSCCKYVQSITLTTTDGVQHGIDVYQEHYKESKDITDALFVIIFGPDPNVGDYLSGVTFEQLIAHRLDNFIWKRNENELRNKN